MNKFSKKKFITLALLMSFLGWPVFIFSATPVGGSITNPIAATSFVALADKILDFLLVVGIPVAVIMIVWSGLLFMTAGGDKEKVTNARRALIWALVGLAVLITGSGFVSIIEDILS